MKIYTKKGDKGSTSLYDCSTVSKSSLLIDLLGDIDELNSFIGIIQSKTKTSIIKNIQFWLFDMGTIIANPKKKYNFDINLEFTKILENEIDSMTEELPKLNNFILPTGNIHLSRAITRRCERKLVFIKENYQDNHLHIDDNCLIFLNRLSDFLFTLARYENKEEDTLIYKKTNILTPIE